MREYFVAGGTLHPESPCYIERDADKRLYDCLFHGEFCYVLTSRQMGKSSLMARTAFKLKNHGFRAVMVDLTSVGQQITQTQWYDGIVMQIAEQLDLDVEAEDYWESRDDLSPAHRFIAILSKVILESISDRLVIFVDEIDVIQSLPFCADDFFAAIRECYERRTWDEAFRGIGFCLLGVASPIDLVSDWKMSPFKSGVAIELNDFTLQETESLGAGLDGGPGTLWEVSHQVYFWTRGHPYLTLRLYKALSDQSESDMAKDVDMLCHSIFLNERSVEDDPNLTFVRSWLLRSNVAESLTEVLRLVRDLAMEQPVKHDSTSPLHKIILLSGVGTVHAGHLTIRNPIYQAAFGENWINRHFPKEQSSRKSHTRKNANSSVETEQKVRPSIGEYGWMMWESFRVFISKDSGFRGVLFRLFGTIAIVLIWVLIEKKVLNVGAEAPFWMVDGLLPVIRLVMIIGFLGGISLIWTTSWASIVAAPITSLYGSGAMINKPVPFYAIAEAKRKRGFFDASIQEITQQLKKFPKDLKGHIMLSDIKAQDLGDASGAVAVLESYLAKNKIGPSASAIVLNKLADIHIKHLKDVTKARAYLQSICNDFPRSIQSETASQRLAHMEDDDHLVRGRASKVYKVQKNNLKLGLCSHSEEVKPLVEDQDEKANQLLQHLVKYPNDTEAREQLAWIYAEHYGDTDQAIEQLRYLVGLKQQPVRSISRWYNQMADIHCRFSGNAESARKALREFVDRFPSSGHSEVILKRMARINLEVKAARTKPNT